MGLCSAVGPRGSDSNTKWRLATIFSYTKVIEKTDQSETTNICLNKNFSDTWCLAVPETILMQRIAAEDLSRSRLGFTYRPGMFTQIYSRTNGRTRIHGRMAHAHTNTHKHPQPQRRVFSLKHTFSNGTQVQIRTTHSTGL